MRFGPIPVAQAPGAILAHATSAGGRKLKKGHVLTADDIAALEADGVGTIVVASLDPDDLDEDEAARRIAAALVTRNIEVKAPATGRVNLHAKTAGVFTVDRSLIDAINAVDPSITVATVAEFAAVNAGQMVATVKIIPFAVAAGLVEEVARLCGGRDAFAVHAFRARRVGLVQTVLPGVKPSVLDKTARITQARLARSGSVLSGERRTAHDEADLAAAIAEAATGNDLVLVFGASAVSDFDDVIPAAIRKAGGVVERFGMPVDPGNLLVLGSVGDVAVIGAPGCARSPKENGFDWILDRLVAGVPVSSAMIAGMGVGGLLMEIPTRPQPRERLSPAAKPVVHAVLLAAGRSSRMGGPNKLMADFDGQPLLARTARRVLASRAAETVVVLGHQAERARAALDGLAVRIVLNSDYATGLSASLKAGVRALPPEAAGALVILGDMPGISAADLDRLVAAFEEAGGQAIVRATFHGKRGNPVILPRALFADVEALTGDTGARHIVESGAADVVDVEIGEGAFLDVDTPEAMHAAGGVLRG
ncbi:4-diphosphocytidyl-2C-methyl-D-erythritol kinase [Aquibium carbonis]|uniref:4-diphosphocytidyl-2C-methyl-D-erythritol kinase n=1 Tax=Aquibium carbonis TaxID=2495581 RepID=A0A429YY00_9HYPH|nr:molybdopterin-binding/glycosyltransferase family 2 protein [Aquibium carbonis]RST86320.1 4-diphosphocytidyl-2C-methyl-D-erythritol kinase [Aquibium carbonis]